MKIYKNIGNSGKMKKQYMVTQSAACNSTKHCPFSSSNLFRRKLATRTAGK